jgi:hypothetical protein
VTVVSVAVPDDVWPVSASGLFRSGGLRASLRPTATRHYAIGVTIRFERTRVAENLTAILKRSTVQ